MNHNHVVMMNALQKQKIVYYILRLILFIPAVILHSVLFKCLTFTYSALLFYVDFLL
jgi:hypothetical protein